MAEFRERGVLAAPCADNGAMSQQRDEPPTEDWWNRLYDESAPDTGPTRGAGDTLDDRFDSAADAMAEGRAEGRTEGRAEARAEGPAEASRADGAGRPALAWWEQAPPSTVTESAFQVPATSPPNTPEPAIPEAIAPETTASRPTVSDPPVPEPAAPEPAGHPSARAPAPRRPYEPTDARPSPGTVPQKEESRLERQTPGSTLPQRTEHTPRTENTERTERTERADARGPRPKRQQKPPTSADAPPATSPEPSPAPPPSLSSPATTPRRPVVPVARAGDEPPGSDPEPEPEPEPTALPLADAEHLDELVPDTVLDGARYGSYTLRAASVRGDSARHRGEPRADVLLTARFGEGTDALLLVAIATGTPGSGSAQRAAAEACHWIGGAVGHNHRRLSEDIRAGRRGDLKSGLHRLTYRGLGRLRARAAELGREPGEYTAGLRCLLLSADPTCRTRVFFGVGDGGLFRLRDGVWQDLEPAVPGPAALTGAPVVGFGSPPAGTAAPDRPVLDGPAAPDRPAAPGVPRRPGDGITHPGKAADGPARAAGDPAGSAARPAEPATGAEVPPPPPSEPFRFRASVARPGDTLLLCSAGLADPVRGEPVLAGELAERWKAVEPPGLAEFLSDVQLRVKGYAADRTAVGVWEA